MVGIANPNRSHARWLKYKLYMFGTCYVHPAILMGHPTNNDWAKLSFCDSLFRKNLLSDKIPEEVFPENSRKNLLPEEEGGLPEELPEYVMEGRVSEFFPEVGFFGRPPSSGRRRFFQKLFCKWFFKMQYFFNNFISNK